MIHRNEIHSYVENHRGEILNTLKELMKIPSVSYDECKRLLNITEKLYNDNGFETEINPEEGYLLSFYGEGERTLGLFAHGDVVPPGENWLLTEPFEPKEIDGYLIGRGGKDDKAAILISLYTAKMLKELSIPFNSKLVMFTGIKEETGMQDVKSYLDSHKVPDFSIVCDNEFPVYCGNKGKIVFTATSSTALKGVTNIKGGEHGTNVAKAEATFPYTPELFEALKAKEGENLKVKAEGNSLSLTAFGISKHSAFPEGSLNAASIIAEAIKDTDIFPEETRETAEFIRKVSFDYYGNSLNINNDEAEFGKLTIVNDEIEADSHGVTLSFNLRHGINVNQTETIERLKKEFASYGFTLNISDTAKAHLTSKEHPMLNTLLDTYNSFTGNKAERLLINPSGTYARFLPDSAEIGLAIEDQKPSFKLPKGHGEIHQPDEYLYIEGFLKAIELTALMILECDKTEL